MATVIGYVPAVIENTNTKPVIVEVYYREDGWRQPIYQAMSRTIEPGEKLDGVYVPVTF